jgi:putative FmdB family regulatory protein
MPLYDFQCEDCDEIFEVRASIREKEAGLKLECPKCHRRKTRQVITAGLMIRSRDDASLSFPACGPNAGPGCCSR